MKITLIDIIVFALVIIGYVIFHSNTVMMYIIMFSLLGYSFFKVRNYNKKGKED